MSLSPQLTRSDDSRQQLLVSIRGWIKFRVLWGIKPSRGQAHTQENECLYRWNRPGPNLCEEWLQAFAGKMDCGCVRAKSAIEKPMRPSAGVKR